MTAQAVAWRRRRWLLALVCCSLSGIIYLQLDRPTFDPAVAGPTVDAAPAHAIPAADTFGMPPLQEYAEVIERPLFVRTRRPFEPIPETPGVPLSALSLVGIVISSEGSRVFVEHGQPRKLVRIGEGESVGGWTVRAILSDRVVLTLGDRREELIAGKPPQGSTSRAVAPGRTGQ